MAFDVYDFLKCYVLTTIMVDTVTKTDFTHELTVWCPSEYFEESESVPVKVRPKSIYCDTGL